MELGPKIALWAGVPQRDREVITIALKPRTARTGWRPRNGLHQLSVGQYYDSREEAGVRRGASFLDDTYPFSSLSRIMYSSAAPLPPRSRR